MTIAKKIKSNADVHGYCGMMDHFIVFNGWLLLHIEGDGCNEIICLLNAQGEGCPSGTPPP